MNKVPKRLKIKVTPQTPGIKTNNFYRRWDIILFECSTRLLKLLLDDASYQKKGFEKKVSDLLNTSEEQLSTDDFTNICRGLDEIQKLEDTKFSKFVVSEMQSLKGMESNPKIQLIPPRTQ